MNSLMAPCLFGEIVKQRQHGRVLDEIGLDDHAVKIEDESANAHVMRADTSRRGATGGRRLAREAVAIAPKASGPNGMPLGINLSDRLGIGPLRQALEVCSSPADTVIAARLLGLAADPASGRPL